MIVLLDDDDYRVTFGLLGRIRVTLKHRGMTRKPSREEGRYLTQVIETLKAAGVPIEPGSEPVEEALRDFTRAIWGGEPTWKAYFLAQTPEDRARYYL